MAVECVPLLLVGVERWLWLSYGFGHCTAEEQTRRKNITCLSLSLVEWSQVVLLHGSDGKLERDATRHGMSTASPHDKARQCKQEERTYDLVRVHTGSNDLQSDLATLSQMLQQRARRDELVCRTNCKPAMESERRERARLTSWAETNSGGFDSGWNLNSIGMRCDETKMLSGPTWAKKPILLTLVILASTTSPLNCFVVAPHASASRSAETVRQRRVRGMDDSQVSTRSPGTCW